MSSVKTLPLELLADAGRYLGKLNHILDKFNNTTNTTPPHDDDDDDNNDSKTSSTVNVVNVVEEDSSLWIPARRFHAWDGKNTLQLRQFVHYIANDARRAMISSIINAFENDIILTLPPAGVDQQLRRGLNHGDYNDANILVSHDDETGNWRVSGVLDFGDSVERYVLLSTSLMSLVAVCTVVAAAATGAAAVAAAATAV
jgi:Phosphotransferase enzyme family